MTRDGDSLYRVIPFHIAECVGMGVTLEEATDSAHVALSDYFMSRDNDFIVPPMETIEPEDLVRGAVIRIDIQVSACIQTDMSAAASVRDGQE